MQIESAFDKVRVAARNVKRWRNGQQVPRWSVAGLLEAEKGFNRIKGYACCRCWLRLLSAR